MERWLEARLRGAPESLRERILRAVHGEGGTGKGEGAGDGVTLPPSLFPLPQKLRSVAESLLAEARAMPASHDTALTLLAADALMTFACEAMAEAAPERLEDLR